MDDLQVFRDDTVLVRGNKNHQTVAKALADDTYPNDHLRMNSVLQNNIEVRLGDIVLIQLW